MYTVANCRVGFRLLFRHSAQPPVQTHVGIVQLSLEPHQCISIDVRKGDYSVAADEEICVERERWRLEYIVIGVLPFHLSRLNGHITHFLSST